MNRAKCDAGCWPWAAFIMAMLCWSDISTVKREVREIKARMDEIAPVHTSVEAQ